MIGIRFEKVSFKEFLRAYEAQYGTGEFYSEEYAKFVYDGIKLPTRATDGSAGYDLYATRGACLGKGVGDGETSFTMPLGIRAVMPKGVAMLILPRSGLGFRGGLHLANTVGLIDSDYQYADNEGDIMLKLALDESVAGTCTWNLGDKIAQAVFLPCLTVDGEGEVTAKRTGGLGSTGE